MKYLHLLLWLVVFFPAGSYAQECSVMLESLKGTYLGECVNGKADGRGKAAGSDSYEGDFRKGLPEGEGKYTWSNKNYYIGGWKKGQREGKGVMYTFPGSASVDSVQNGFWKKDKFVGAYEKPFEVKNMTGRLSRLNCRLSDRKGKNLSFTISKIGEGLVSVGDVNIISGTFYNRNTQNMTNISVVRFTDLTFPFRAIFAFTNGEFADIIFYEKGDYDIDVQLI